MSAVKNSDIQDIFQFMGEFWTVIKQLWVPEKTEEYAIQMLDTLDALGNKYPDRFCRMMLLAYFEYLEEKMYPGRAELFQHRASYMNQIGNDREAKWWTEVADREMKSAEMQRVLSEQTQQQ